MMTKFNRRKMLESPASLANALQQSNQVVTRVWIKVAKCCWERIGFTLACCLKWKKLDLTTALMRFSNLSPSSTLVPTFVTIGLNYCPKEAGLTWRTFMPLPALFKTHLNRKKDNKRVRHTVYKKNMDP